MTRALLEAERQSDLRLKAVSQLSRHRAASATAPSGVAALEILYRLASSPETAPEALALLHELQVHQVELQIQAEELNSSRAECEAALIRQTQLYDFAPVGNFTVDGNTTISELNLMGAHLLGSERDALFGRPLDSYLTLPSRQELRRLLTEASEGKHPGGCVLELIAADGTRTPVYVSVEPDPAAACFLLAVIKTAERGARPAN
jgi:PAS domain S-box-containing protein